jgi:phosphatidylserine/phosphatidylglycerophosphate/cardiolipin synthase-like enzyme
MEYINVINNAQHFIYIENQVHYSAALYIYIYTVIYLHMYIWM